MLFSFRLHIFKGFEKFNPHYSMMPDYPNSNTNYDPQEESLDDHILTCNPLTSSIVI